MALAIALLLACLAPVSNSGRASAAEFVEPVPAALDAASSIRLPVAAPLLAPPVALQDAPSLRLPPSAIPLQAAPAALQAEPAPALPAGPAAAAPPALSAAEAASLEEIGTRPGGSAADYEVKRLALRRLAENGKLVSLPSISDEHAAEILRGLARSKPDLAAIDFDGTLHGNEPLSAETGAALDAAASRGGRTVILTGRPLRSHGRYTQGIIDGLGALRPEQRASITVGAHSGAVLFGFDPAGEPVELERAPAWSPSEKEAVQEAARRTAAAYGWPAPVETSDYDLFMSLPWNLDAAAVEAAGERMRREVSERAGSLPGGVPFVFARHSASRDYPSYLFVRKYDKTASVRRLLGPSANGASALLIGDQFLGKHGVDAEMARGAPGALAISVGGTADPRLDNVFVWPRKGPEGSRELLDALAVDPARAASAREILAAPGFKPGMLVHFLKQDPELRGEYVRDSGVREGYSLERHTRMMMRQFERYFSGPLPGGTDRGLFRLMLAFHDIGKARAVAAGDKNRQHEFTAPLMSKHMKKLGFAPAEIRLAVGLVDGDPIGPYLRGGSLEAAAREIRDMADKAGMAPKDFLPLVLVFYMSDASSYTRNAGGIPSLDRLFRFDPAQGRIRFAPRQARRIEPLLELFGAAQPG